MATLRNKRKLAAVSRETSEGSRTSRAQNVLDPELTQDYISQVSDEIEVIVTKKLCKEFSGTESRILGALSKLDEFLLNPQVWTCSVAVPGTSRNTNLENRETTGDRSSDNPYPKVGYFSHHSGQLNSPETETNPHMVTGATGEIRQHPHMMTATQEEIPYCSPTTSSGKQKKARSQVNHNFSTRIPLRQLRQTRFRWPSNNWRRTPIQPISVTILAVSRNCLNLSHRQCPRSVGNQKILNCLNIYSKRVQKSTISSQKKTI